MRKNVIKLTCLASAALLAQGVTAPIMADTVAGLNAETGVTSQHSNGTRNARTPLRFATSTSAVALSSSSSSSSSSSAVDWSSKDPYAVMGTLPLTQPNDVWQATGPNNATEIVYSYNPGYATPAGNDDGMGDSVVDGEPDATVNYQRISAWDATSQDGFNGQNVNEIAAVLYAGYPNCLGNTQNIYSAPISNSQVNQWYQAYLQKTGKNSAEYSLDQYEYDMTQYAIWGVEGNVAGGSNAGTAQSQYKNDPLSLALYNYGVQLLNSNGQPIGAKQVYTIDRSTGCSKDFQVVNGDMTVPTSNDYYVADANGNKVSVLVPGVKYHLVLAVNGSDPTTISMLCNYVQTESVDFYHSDVPTATSLSGQPNTAKLPWANMIGMGVTTGKVTLNFAVVSSSSSSSSAVSSSSSSSASSSSSSVSSSRSSSASSSSSSSSSSLSSSLSSAVDSSSSKSSSSSSSKSSSSTKTTAKTSSSSKATNAKSSSSSKVADNKTSSSSVAPVDQSSSSVAADPNASSSSSAVQPATNTSVASSSQKPATADNKVPAASAGAPTTAKHAATSAQRTNTNRHVAPAANKAVLAHGATDKQAADAQSVATQRHDKRALPDTGDAVAAGLTLTGMAALLGGAALVLKKRKD